MNILPQKRIGEWTPCRKLTPIHVRLTLLEVRQDELLLTAVPRSTLIAQACLPWRHKVVESSLIPET